MTENPTTGPLDPAAMAARIAELGATAAPLGPEEFGAYIRSELVKFTAVARAAEVRLN